MKTLVVTFIAALVGLAQEPQKPVRDLTTLVGKRVTAQRAPLCQPGTYSVVFAYAGKEARVISLKPSKIAPVSKAIMERMNPQARAMLEDAQNAATILVEFDDGTQLDTCAPIGPSRLPDHFELAPGQTLQRDARASSASPAENDAKAAAPNPDRLSESEVNLATSGKGRDRWVEIEDRGLMAAQGNQIPSITLYMPDAVIAIQSESAKKQFTRYEPAEEEKMRSLVIVAQGYAGKTITDGCTSVTRVVLLSDSSGGVVEEASVSEPLEERWRNNMGPRIRVKHYGQNFAWQMSKKLRPLPPTANF